MLNSVRNIKLINEKTKSNQKQIEKKIAPIFLLNGLSSTVIIPIEFARKYGIDKRTHVTLEDTNNGILIRKLEVKN